MNENDDESSNNHCRRQNMHATKKVSIYTTTSMLYVLWISSTKTRAYMGHCQQLSTFMRPEYLRQTILITSESPKTCEIIDFTHLLYLAHVGSHTNVNLLFADADWWRAVLTSYMGGSCITDGLSEAETGSAWLGNSTETTAPAIDYEPGTPGDNLCMPELHVGTRSNYVLFQEMLRKSLCLQVMTFVPTQSNVEKPACPQRL